MTNPSTAAHDESWPNVAPSSYWDERYSGADHVWSSKPNATLVDIAAPLSPGRSLDLGCGEGGDVVWLAAQGWSAAGVDISSNAVARATATAKARDADATFTAADLGSWEPGETYDLVTASFFHSPVELPRATVLHRAMTWVAPGGRLVLVTHAAAPPWAEPEHVAHHTFLTAQQELDELAPDPATWTVEVCEHSNRRAEGPGGRTGDLEDGVVVLRRH